MKWLGRVGMGLCVAYFIASIGSGAENGAQADSAMTLDEYTKLVMRQSDRARLIYNSFKNAVNARKVSYRQSRLPTASVSSRLSKGKTDVDGVETTGQDRSASVSVSQPFHPTGATISGAWTDSLSKSETSGVKSQTETDPSLAATISQPLNLFVGNVAWRQWRIADINYSMAEGSYKYDILALKNQARSVYYDVISKRERLAVERFKFKSSEQSFKITQAMVKAGRYAGVELSRAQVRFETDARNVEDAETNYKKAVNDALSFASINLMSDINFTTPLTFSPLQIPLQKLLKHAFENRPDYLNAKKSLELAEISVRNAKEADNLQLTAQAGISSTDSGTLVSKSKTRAWTGGVLMTWPLFDSGQTSLNVRTAQNNKESQQISLRQLERQIEKEVSNAFLDIKNLERQMNDLKRSKELARQTVQVVQTRYRNGLDRLIDVFDSENSLRETELSYIDVLIRGNMAKDSLALLIGGALEEVAE